uniref:Uncharacterized protein n=1 Tax=Picea glauca TaxID=3330 RepID=A0A101LZA9_PICGL|nr:hypothetical protein ABT39_MTgene5132 [Picea glauca]
MVYEVCLEYPGGYHQNIRRGKASIHSRIPKIEDRTTELRQAKGYKASCGRDRLGI